MRAAILLALASFAIPAAAQGRVVGPGGTVIARVASIDDRCAAGEPLLATLRVVRTVRGLIRDREQRVVFACGAPIHVGALVRATLERGGVPIPGSDFHARLDGAIARHELPGLDPRTILGRSRAELDREHRLVATEADGSYYESGLVVRYDASDLASSMTLTVPPGLDCTEVPGWLGLPAIPGSAPLRRRDGCEWPGLSPRHVLAPGIAAALRGGELTIERR